MHLRACKESIWRLYSRRGYLHQASRKVGHQHDMDARPHTSLHREGDFSMHELVQSSKGHAPAKTLPGLQRICRTRHVMQCLALVFHIRVPLRAGPVRSCPNHAMPSVVCFFVFVVISFCVISSLQALNYNVTRPYRLRRGQTHKLLFNNVALNKASCATAKHAATVRAASSG